MIKKIHLDFDFSKFLNANYTSHTGSCIKHQVYELEDIHEQFGGFPKTYCFENTMIHQLWWTETDIDYVELGKKLNMEVVTVSTIMQPPGCTVPLHRDTFFQIKKKYPNRKEVKVRANIYLEDYKLGHFLQYQQDKTFITSVNWLKGDGFIWNSDILHLSTNAGMQPKYTLQVSGFLL